MDEYRDDPSIEYIDIADELRLVEAVTELVALLALEDLTRESLVA
ncbi:MAG TPA: hypothetical protein VEI83_08780 [Acidimicrobiales bacterium]|nr:hypothetical protein [Acidimicrobiales bacterium]